MMNLDIFQSLNFPFGKGGNGENKNKNGNGNTGGVYANADLNTNSNSNAFKNGNGLTLANQEFKSILLAENGNTLNANGNGIVENGLNPFKQTASLVGNSGKKFMGNLIDTGSLVSKIVVTAVAITLAMVTVILFNTTFIAGLLGVIALMIGGVITFLIIRFFNKLINQKTQNLKKQIGVKNKEGFNAYKKR